MSAFAGQIAILKNGFSIHFDHKEQNAKSTRLFTSTGYLDIASDQITSFEEDETPVVPEPAPVAAAPSTQLTSSDYGGKAAGEQAFSGQAFGKFDSGGSAGSNENDGSGEPSGARH